MDYEKYVEKVVDSFHKLKSRRWRLDHLYWIVNEKGEEILFNMNFAQKIFYLGMWFCNLILKSRQHGITTEVCLFYLDTCFFNANTHAAIIAHNKEDAEAFFNDKIKFAYDRLPKFLRDANPADGRSARVLRFKNGSSIRVTTSGRSGTYQLVHISEFGKICAKYPEKAREIITGTLNAVHPGMIVTIESTAEGREGKFYELSVEAQKLYEKAIKLTRMDYKFFFFGWAENELNRLPPDEAEHVKILDYQLKYFQELEEKHGIKTDQTQRAWYVKKWNVQGDDMKREHPSTWEEAFEAAIIGAYYRVQFQRIYKQRRICDVPYQPGVLVDTWWDLGLDDSTSIWFTQNIGRKVHVINYYECADEEFMHYYDKLQEFSEDLRYRYGRHVAPHDVVKRDPFTKKSYKQSAAKLGIKFEIAPKTSIQSGIEATRQILNICWFDEEKTTMKFAENLVGVPSIEQYRKEWNEKAACYRNTPLHNWASHGADAFRTLGVAHTWALPYQSSTDIQSKAVSNREKADAGGWT